METTRYLLDTHVVLWLATDPVKIPLPVRNALQDADTLFVSSVSAYELGQKVRIGKLPQAAGLLERWETMLELMLAGDLPITAKEALLASRLA